MLETAVFASAILMSIAGIKYLTRRKRNPDAYAVFHSDEYAKALQEYRTEGKQALKRYELL